MSGKSETDGHEDHKEKWSEIEQDENESKFFFIKLMNEIKNHKTFKHENIVGFQHYFEDYENVYLMLELCENESLN